MEPGAKVRAIFDFIASAPDELPLHIGDIIVLQQKVDHDWLIGSCNGQSGTFPANFVELVVDEAAASSSGRFARGQKVVSVETYNAGADGDLSFKKGDVIEITKQIDDNWLEGRLGNETGIFPVTYISEEVTQHASTPGDILQARALRDNLGQLQDELSFQKNDIITIVEKIDEDWYRGTFNGKTGTLPALNVEILKPGIAVQPPTSSDVGKDTVDYNAVNERLKSAMQGGKSSAPGSPKIANNHSGEPWAKATFLFTAEHPGEISLMDGDRVTLRRRVDENWLEGEVGGNVGIFPSNYVQIQVDIPEGYVPPEKPASNSSSTSKPQTLPVPSGSANNNNLKAGAGKWKGKRVKVLFDFSAVTDQDLGVKQGDVITIIDKVDADWFEAKHPSGRTGFLPVNYVKVLDKPKTPSFKRPAPLPPKETPSPATQNGSAASSATNSVNMDLLDIFSTPPETTGKPDANAKPPLPPKSAKVLSTEKPKAPSAIDDLLCFDPLADNPGDTSPHILPDVQPLKPQATSDQVGFKLSGGAYRPVNFASKQSPPDGTAAKPSSAANPFSNIKSADEAQSAQGHSLMDMSPMDKPSTSILAPLSAPLSPPPLDPVNVSQTPTSKPPLQKKPSYELFSAKPFAPVTTTKIHSVARPGSQGSSGSPTSPKSPKSPKLKQGLLTPMQVNQELDRALCEVDASSSPPTSEPSKPKFNPFSATDSAELAPETLPPVPPRQPSPNPFSAENKLSSSEIPPPLPPRQPSPNPFKAESPPLTAPPPSQLPPPIITQSVPQTIQPLAPTPAPKPQLPPPLPTSNPPCQNPLGLRPVDLIRDDSVASDFSDDYLMQNINFSIRPSNSDFQAPTAFKLPPPPTKSKIKASTVESPRSRRKFNPKSAVPRPRGRSLDREGGSSSEDYELPPDQNTQADREQFQQDLRSFQASVQQMFDPSKFEANGDDDLFGMPHREPPPPPDGVAIATDQTASLLDGAFDDFAGTPPPASTTQTSESSAPVADILGLGLDPPATSSSPASGSKMKPSRTAPGRPKEPAPKKKAMPPRPAPPKFGPGHRSAEDELLAKLRPEGNNQLDLETQETVNALQGSIAELKEAIAVQQVQKKTYEQMLQAATAEEIEDMEQQLTDCIGTIENMQTEMQSLEEQLQEVRPTPAPESKMTAADFREKVITELVTTEQDYVRDIKLCQEGFMMVLKDKQDVISQILIRQQLEEIERSGEKKPTKGLELEILFGNMEQVIETAEKFLKDLEETTEGKAPEEQVVGQVFMQYSNDLHKVYAEYCRNHDDATTLLEKYEENDEVQEYINQGLELVRQSTNCWDLASFLIKPVQRILKYQLLLTELDKYTDDSVSDKPNLQEAIQTMMEVAKAINEFKRRKDLVMKYRRPGQEAISDKLGKLTFHSIKKKSQRINERFTRMTGLTTQTVDGDFDQMERRFKNLEKTIRIYVKDVNAYLEQLKDATSSEAAVGSDISDYYASQSNLHEVNKYEAVQRHLANKLYKDYTLFVQQRVISPLNGLLIMFQGPHKLIDKRYDKLLDYDSYSKKLEKNKDKDRVKQLKDEKDVAKKNYEALNVQLKDELPKLCDMGLSLFKSCVVSFVEAERDHINSTLKKLYPLLELSIVKSSSLSDIMKTFETSHMAAVEDMHKFSFVPKSLDKKGDRRSVYGTNSEPTPPPSAPRPDPGSQSEKQKASITSRYPANRVYQVSTEFNSQQPMDMSVKKGEIVGIIKEQDPTGSGQKWYVDNGASQGFIPSAILQAVGGETTSPEGYGSDDDWNAFTQRQQQAQYYYAEWEFTASAENELSLAERDVVQLISDRDIEGNSEWWLMDKNGQRGYVPSAYLAKID
ncbi:dynamin-binding protein-like isoform X2 [Patiria miniata]|uniref:Dynamin-binding protein n=1 Tax=Patiria miniata TaxID=46514 RepID=A0A913ZNW9_PATMI|nr:dynamin-binding protein-like isoform X2 [Patiria miniata]